jgi:hypothetical protein
MRFHHGGQGLPPRNPLSRISPTPALGGSLEEYHRSYPSNGGLEQALRLSRWSPTGQIDGGSPPGRNWAPVQPPGGHEGWAPLVPGASDPGGFPNRLQLTTSTANHAFKVATLMR